MKPAIFKLCFLSLCFLMSACSSVHTKWFVNGPWYNKLGIVAYEDIDKKEFESQYQKNKTAWDLAFKYLKETDLQTVAPGKYPLDGENVFVSVTEGPGKDFNNTNWESHRKYVDIQYIVKGKEKIGVTPLSKTMVTKAYDEKKDVANYSADGKFYVAKPGVMYVFYPNDAHRPSIKVDENAIKKVVVKIRYVN